MACPADPSGGLSLCSAEQPSPLVGVGAACYWGAPANQASAQLGLESAVVALALALAAFHLWQLLTRGFREWTLLYYCLVVAAQYLLSLTANGAVPIALYVPCTAPVNWLRYAAWVLIMPAMVMALCRVTGLSSVYPRLQDPMLLLHLLMLVLGVSTAAAADVTTKAVLFALAGAAGLVAVVYTAIQYVELYYTLNIVACRRAITPLAALWYAVWLIYPILFILGPEGFGSLSAPSSAIGYAVADLIKLLWSLCAWNINQLCRKYAKKHGTISKKVALPFGLGAATVRTFYNAADAETADPAAEEEAEVAAAMLQEPEMPQKRKSRGNRLSLDVKERLVGISRRTSATDSARASVESGRQSVESDPGAYKPDGTTYRRAGRLSVDMKRRLDSISTRTSAESGPDRTSTNSARPRMGGSRLSTDMSVRLAVIEQKRASEDTQASDRERRVSAESMKSEGDLPDQTMPWDQPPGASPSKKHPTRQPSEGSLQPGGSNLMRHSFQKSRSNRSSLDSTNGRDKEESLVDCGPSPMPSGLVRVLVAARDPELLAAIRQQLQSTSAELPIKIQEATTDEQLANIADTVALNMKKPVDLAMVHSSMVRTPGTKTLKVEKSVPIVAFGTQEYCGERGADYNDWLEIAEGYAPGSDTSVFDRYEVLRVISYWQHKSDRRRSSNS
eukprot:jgi/Tetstr1/443388/TSEL_031403.t1